MNIYEKLLSLQQELKCPKNQYNDFGKYNYRNAEDILEVAKPLCFKYKTLLFLSDEIKNIGNRNYVESTATFINIENPEEKITVTASAREEETKKGMDGSQITGASSSYARKYALNGLFDIDDTKDSDTTNTGYEQPKKPAEKKEPLTLATAEKKIVKRASGDEVQMKSLSSEELELVVKNCTGELKSAAQIILDFRAETEKEKFMSEIKQGELPFEV